MHPIPVSERISVVYIDRGCLELDGHQLVVSDVDRLTTVPVGTVAVLMLGPGVSVTHAAVRLCADEKCLLLWNGEHGVRLYAAGNPRSSAESIVHQAILHANPSTRLSIARKIFTLMFGENAPPNRSIEQLRGLEGARVKKLYEHYAQQHEVKWEGKSGDLSCPVNAALAGVNAALYGVTEAAILALGYSPAIGFVHAGDPRSFVFDVADTVKFSSVAPLAFKLAHAGSENMEHRSRTAARDLFVRKKLLEQIVANIEVLMTE